MNSPPPESVKKFRTSPPRVAGRTKKRSSTYAVGSRVWRSGELWAQARGANARATTNALIHLFLIWPNYTALAPVSRLDHQGPQLREFLHGVTRALAAQP